MSETEAQQPTEETADLKNAASKQEYRQKVWQSLENNRIAIFPRPVFNRIPNFRGADKAASKLLELEEFKSAKAVEVNPDKSLEFARIIALENKKDLYVPIPRLKESLLKKLSVSGDCTKYHIRHTISRWGMENTGTPIGISDDVSIDLLIVGSVAVSKEGYRIGKGKGYADLEFAVLKEMGSINDDTVILTIVHESQVFDTLPSELFKKHDVPVDYILTPNEVIKVSNKLPRPAGIFWDILSERRLNLMPVLQKLRAKHQEAGKDITLKEESSDTEEREPRPPRKFRSFPRRKNKSAGNVSQKDDNQIAIDGKKAQRRYRRYRRSRSYRNSDRSTSNGQTNSENAENIPPQKKKPMGKFFRRFPIDFSLMVSNIEKNVRIRDLKVALTASGIKPNDITWRGYKGFCYLHYAKPNKKKNSDESKPFAVDNVIEILQNLKITPDCTTNLNVKVMEPITRIETTDVTAV